MVFTNTSSGDYSSSLWDFGDSITSTLDSPVHTYTTTGEYTVTLTASGLGGTDVVTHPNLISVLPGNYDGTAHVQSIKMRYSERGAKGYIVTAYIRIVDEDNQAVSGATVHVEWELPNGSQGQDSDTKNAGTARFTVKSNFPGSYEICVTDVVKENWLYDPDANVETCETLMIAQ